jgi:exodeoxyribonuclease VII large subunit
MYPGDSVLNNDSILTVAQLNRQVGQLLQGQFSQVWVKGEVSNFTQAASGHWYFTVKDERAAVRAVMFRGRAAAVGFVPKAGERFEFRANVTLYEPRGDYQLQVEVLRRAGRGDLHEAFLLLKEKLAAEGLFDPERKRPVKALPRAIGVVTSLAAAALRDVLSALARRAPHVSIVIYPTPVQGLDAAEKITEAVRAAIRRNEVDTLLLVRGGGSLEDLWSFNDETLAREIAASPIPIISGVGHETDFTIADFVADVRAPTPTAAAELCCQARQVCLAQVQSAVNALATQQYRLLEMAALRLDRAVASLVSPQQRVRQQHDRLRVVKERLARAASTLHDRRTARLGHLGTRLVRVEPGVAGPRRALAQAAGRLSLAARRQWLQRQAQLAGITQTLEALSPKNILARGYALVRNEHGVLVKNALDLSTGQRLDIELSRGKAEVSVLHAQE